VVNEFGFYLWKFALIELYTFIGIKSSVGLYEFCSGKMPFLRIFLASLAIQLV
jgi:hypothetical protein